MINDNWNAFLKNLDAAKEKDESEKVARVWISFVCEQSELDITRWCTEVGW